MHKRVPTYRNHKASGQAIVEINGRHFYLGKFDSPESHEAYRRKIAAYLSQQELDDTPLPSLRIDRLILKYFKFAKTYYVRNGKQTEEIVALRIALKRLRKMYGSTEAVKFGPKAFKTFRDSMIQEDLSRKYINDTTGRIKRMFKWGVAEELIPPAVFQALTAVPGLRKGRSGARETEKILPVPDDVVDATLPFLTEVVADMVRLQRLAGMRPAEVCILRPCDIDRSAEVWIYVPQWHKTEHADKERLIPLGPKCQEILQKYLDRNPDDYCFRPCDSERQRKAERHANRKTPLRYGNRPGTSIITLPKRTAGEKYNTASYRRAIQRACDKAFPHPKRSVELTAQERQEWRSEHRWAPNRLRHSAATEIRRKFGLEAAQVVLGHSAANVTQIYAEKDYELAVRVAREVG
ncbi:tyrosine-type recombinase/integrase [Bythopirellula polymerisocia]|uniref:Site-specific tyrosine recombinase XerC n=1 Tax=Bythopirellula polymerisocia TaxID=2528003 RepID=A0A5C6CUN5_9BACT|nr:site-specific integrase [Bythopirellula polymerisocia]TWU27565.1 site-specific tyrosine recombinase XerC [Bythopirellula polymerisocia]